MFGESLAIAAQVGGIACPLPCSTNCSSVDWEEDSGYLVPCAQMAVCFLVPFFAGIKGGVYASELSRVRVSQYFGGDLTAEIFGEVRKALFASPVWLARGFSAFVTGDHSENISAAAAARKKLRRQGNAEAAGMKWLWCDGWSPPTPKGNARRLSTKAHPSQRIPTDAYALNQ